MKLNYGASYDRPPLTVGGGVGQGLDIAFASYEQLRLVDNSNAAAAALQDAYAARTQAIKAATGIDLGDPLFGEQAGFDPAQAQRLARDQFGAELSAQAGVIEQRKAAYQQRLEELAKQFPQHASVIRAAVPVERDAEEVARKADEHLATLMASNPGWDKFAWAFAGGAVGSMRDPMVVGSLALGGGPGAARTVAGRILTVGFKEALLNGASTLAAQPMVQDWRRRAGLPNGFNEGAANVAFAAALGGAIGAGGRGVAEVVDAFGRRSAVSARLEQLALDNPELADKARRAMTGDTSAAASMLDEIRDLLPDDVRGAVDAQLEADAYAAQRAAEIAHITERRHELLQSRAEQAAFIRELAAPAPVLEDTARINRLVRELAPKADSIADPQGQLGQLGDIDATIRELRDGIAADEAARRPVASFLKRLGGIDPGSAVAAELRAIGIDARSAPGLFSRSGLKALDNIPIDELPDGIRLHAGADDGNGYARQQAFIDGVQAELEGRPWHDPNATDNSAANIDAYRTYLEANGVDFGRMSDAEIRDQILAINDAERRFLAAEPNDLGLATDEVAFLPPGVTRRAYTADVVRQILDRVGEVPDEVVKAAADAHIAAGETLDDAIDFALAQASGTRRTLPESQFRELGSEPPDPFAPRSGETANRLGDPAAEADAIDWKALEELGTAEGLLVPFGDDMMSLEALKVDLDETAWLEKVVEACKL